MKKKYRRLAGLAGAVGLVLALARHDDRTQMAVASARAFAP